MAIDTRDLVTSYIRAVGENRLEALPAMLDWGRASKIEVDDGRA